MSNALAPHTGLFTETYLRTETPQSIQQMREIEQSAFEWTKGTTRADYVLSIYEVSSIFLARSQDKSPREIVAFQHECATILERIDNRPEQWEGGFGLTPETARSWFTQQIETLREAVVAAQ